jgi:hypothetical protein
MKGSQSGSALAHNDVLLQMLERPRTCLPALSGITPCSALGHLRFGLDQRTDPLLGGPAFQLRVPTSTKHPPKDATDEHGNQCRDSEAHAPVDDVSALYGKTSGG